MQTEVKNELTFSLFFKSILRYWVVILICSVLFCALGLGYARFFRSDSYRCTASFWVNPNSSAGANSSSTAAASQMAANYAELVKSDKLLRRAVENRDGGEDGDSLDAIWNCRTDDAVKRLGSMLRASKSEEDSCMFYVTVTAATPEMAFQAIEAVQYAIPAFIEDGLSDGYTVKLMGEVHSKEDAVKTGRSYTKFAFVGFVAGLALSSFGCFIYGMTKGKKESNTEENL